MPSLEQAMEELYRWLIDANPDPPLPPFTATKMGARHLPVDGTSLAFTVPRMMGSRGNPNRGISPAVTYYDMRKQ